MDNRYVQQFKKGSLEMILLCLIGRKETYGYEIITELNNSASVLGYAKEGTIYPDRKSTRLNSSHPTTSRMPSSA